MQFYVVTGLLLAIFGFVSLLIVAAVLLTRPFQELTKFDYIVSVSGGALRNILLIVVGFSVFYFPAISGVLAWTALVVFIISVLVTMAKKYEEFRFSNLKPSFYLTSAFIGAAAVILTYGDAYSV
ncbi:hypothetical protein [Thiohalophilus thiocyanatoxydans]|uniref:hypothetical protein n=1 Tax=Thiohalophilus thiocyanatoxydans TaxID=381308 RepID=UPI001065DB5E|nr:hypothetical protein [Thiohalophilus thiocyanatoxydans]